MQRRRVDRLLGGFAVMAAFVLEDHSTIEAATFHRGDANDDGALDLTDGTYVLNFLFLAGPGLPCREAADANNDATIDLTDGVYLFNFLFLGGPAPVAPGGVDAPCGEDPDAPGSPGDLGCEEYTHCEASGPATGEFERLVDSYGVLSTVAGKGDFRQGGFNGWSSTFEGGQATEAELSRPHFAMTDDAGFLYIADKDAHAIRRVDHDGIITTVAGTSVSGDDGDEPGPAHERRLASPNGLWVRGDGTLYVLDLGNGKVRRVGPDGTMTTLFAVDGGIAIGRGLWVADDESLAWIASGNRVVRWTPTDGAETWVDGFASLGNLVVDPQGDLVVTDRSAHRVYRVEADRSVTPIAGNGTRGGGGSGEKALDTGLNEVRGVWFFPNGGYLVATHEGSQVWYVDTRGYIHLFLDGRPDHSHTGDGELFHTPGFKISEARAIALDAAGNILITENDFGYIRRIVRR